MLCLEQLSVSFRTRQGMLPAVRDVSLSLHEGETLALVGESGCGKSVLCKSIMKLLPPTAHMESGSIRMNGVEIAGYSEREMRRLRGSFVSMIFQDPMTALNPAMTIGAQIAEAVRLHEGRLSKAQVSARVMELMELVGIEDAKDRSRMYPYHFSGGMRQRAVLAIALAARPRILLADEPTTALDVTIQAQMLELLRDLQRQLGMAILFVTHDLSVVGRVADRVAVMCEGRIVERGKTEKILRAPEHPYTKKLLAAIPSNIPRKCRQTAGAETLLSVSHLTKKFRLNRRKSFSAVDDVSLEIRRGEVFGLVGESGCGKSTLARCIMDVYPYDAGEIFYQGSNISGRLRNRKEKKYLQASRQLIFQDSSSSLDQRMKVADIIAEPMKLHHRTPKRGSYRAEAEFQLKYVEMDAHFLDCYPAELSGGQRQRVAIARALAMEPKLLVADEPLASLDVLTQAEIVSLFMHLQKEHGFTILFIAHDLAMVRLLCDRVGVMYQGRLVEVEETETLFEHPKHPYTKRLLAAMPALALPEAMKGEIGIE